MTQVIHLYFSNTGSSGRADISIELHQLITFSDEYGHKVTHRSDGEIEKQKIIIIKLLFWHTNHKWLHIKNFMTGVWSLTWKWEE